MYCSCEGAESGDIEFYSVYLLGGTIFLHYSRELEMIPDKTTLLRCQEISSHDQIFFPHYCNLSGIFPHHFPVPD